MTITLRFQSDDEPDFSERVATLSATADFDKGGNLLISIHLSLDRVSIKSGHAQTIYSYVACTEATVDLAIPKAEVCGFSEFEPINVNYEKSRERTQSGEVKIAPGIEFEGAGVKGKVGIGEASQGNETKYSSKVSYEDKECAIIALKKGTGWGRWIISLARVEHVMRDFLLGRFDLGSAWKIGSANTGEIRVSNNVLFFDHNKRRVRGLKSWLMGWRLGRMGIKGDSLAKTNVKFGFNHD